MRVACILIPFTAAALLRQLSPDNGAISRHEPFQALESSSTSSYNECNQAHHTSHGTRFLGDWRRFFINILRTFYHPQRDMGEEHRPNVRHIDGGVSWSSSARGTLLCGGWWGRLEFGSTHPFAISAVPIVRAVEQPTHSLQH